MRLDAARPHHLPPPAGSETMQRSGFDGRTGSRASTLGSSSSARRGPWRAGLRIHEALALSESDLDRRRGSLVVRRGKGGRRREAGMDEWAWEQLEPWSTGRLELPVRPLFCIISGPTRGRPWSAAAARTQLRRTAAAAGVRRRFAPHQLRHAHAVEMAHEGVPLIVIQRQLGHSNLGITSIYLKASRTPKSSTPSTLAARRWFS